MPQTSILKVWEFHLIPLKTDNFNEMNCKRIHKKLIFFLEGDLTGREAEEVSAHLLRCDECAAFAEEMRKTLGMVELEKSPVVTPFFYTRLKARLEREEAEALRPAGFSVWERILQPAIFSLLLLIGIYAGIKIGQPTSADLNSFYLADTELVPYLNELDAEPIESFLME
jgi:anti-sigma factor RsiW